MTQQSLSQTQAHFFGIFFVGRWIAPSRAQLPFQSLQPVGNENQFTNLLRFFARSFSIVITWLPQFDSFVGIPLHHVAQTITTCQTAKEVLISVFVTDVAWDMRKGVCNRATTASALCSSQCP
ncbi:hypothetical protein BDU57DRAFT_4681 [Ampelomyces quisqualis]|uniref:Uncharacterized protein n=1 Tax=Ampelomyces quisqualis TaxID=50730 RepID=A0A6A5R216_AMPQU|nr:hypothetical protein BDU57DRAFT_4681 [Ampelomyces quisqualis]